jgi:hypothetical protein
VQRKRQGGEGLGKVVPVKVAEVQNMARHVLSTTGAVALRAALESAVQLGRRVATRRSEQASLPVSA